MSYNEVPNTLVDSVVLPKKQLSNREIINAAKTQSLNGFRGVFLRDTLPKKAKLNECGILNLDSSSDDGPHWIMWFKKVRMSSISIVMICSLLVSWLHIKSPIFDNSERIQQNGEVFCGHLCLFELKQLSLGDNLQEFINYLI